MRGFLPDGGTQFHSKVDLDADFFVSKVRNQKLGCLLRGGVAGRIAGLLLRDPESFKGLPDLRMIVDEEDKFAFQILENPAQLSKIVHREDTIAVVIFASIIRRIKITSNVLKGEGV